MTQPMTAKEFESVTTKDFTNGAIRDEIHAALKQREKLQAENQELLEMNDHLLRFREWSSDRDYMQFLRDEENDASS